MPENLFWGWIRNETKTVILEKQILSKGVPANHSTIFYKKMLMVFPLWFWRIRHAAQPADARSFPFLPCAPPMEQISHYN